jgi:murein DD-endopeptidase MepM/ murein hydrolase activator NlpD
VTLFLVVSLLPISVYAGPVGNFFSNIFKGDQENLFSTENIQNMNLLVASAVPVAGSENKHVPVVEHNALVPEVGPQGTAQESVHKITSDQISVYVVREGDTLSQIAEMFNVTVNTIKWGNDLSSNTLKKGDVLVILPISGVKHTVKKGDTVQSLAKKYKGDIEEILDYNNLKEGDALEVGSIVIIPDGEVLPAPSSSGSGVRSGSSSSLKEYSGYYLRPVAGGKKTQGIHGYNGVDLAGPVGTPIYAAADGEVIISRSGGWNGGYGNYVVIRHPNGTQTLYSHNSRNNVSVGDNVKQGDVIGFIGATGKATGPHLHFEIRGAKNPF